MVRWPPHATRITSDKSTNDATEQNNFILCKLHLNRVRPLLRLGSLPQWWQQKTFALHHEMNTMWLMLCEYNWLHIVASIARFCHHHCLA